MKKERKLEQNFTLKLKKDNAYQSYIHSSQYIKVLDLFENDSPAFRLYLIQRESERLANQPNFKNNTQNVKQEFDNLIDDYVESYKKLKIGSSEPSDGLFEKLQNLILIVASRCNCNHLFQLQMVDLFTESENGLLNLLYFDEHRNNGGYIDQELSDDALKLESIYKKIARHSVIMDHLNTHHEQAQPEVADASSKQDNSSFFGNWSIFS